MDTTQLHIQPHHIKDYRLLHMISIHPNNSKLMRSILFICCHNHLPNIKTRLILFNHSDVPLIYSKCSSAIHYISPAASNLLGQCLLVMGKPLLNKISNIRGESDGYKQHKVQFDDYPV